MVIRRTKAMVKVSRAEMESIIDFCTLLKEITDTGEFYLEDIVEDIAEGMKDFDCLEFKIMD